MAFKVGVRMMWGLEDLHLFNWCVQQFLPQLSQHFERSFNEGL